MTSATNAPDQGATDLTTTPTRMRKHSLDIAGHRTSISLEDAFWGSLRGIALHHGVSLASLVARIDAERADANLSSAIRVYVLQQARTCSSNPAQGL